MDLLTTEAIGSLVGVPLEQRVYYQATNFGCNNSTIEFSRHFRWFDLVNVAYFFSFYKSSGLG